MENARMLDERLRRIIGEVGGRAGGEIKKSLLADYEAKMALVVEAQVMRETARFLKLLKEAVNKL
ncbi:MAG: hypothetical protein ACYC0Q_14895 [Eubacteriales bacterium]